MMAEGKHIYQEACDEKNEWNAEVSTHLSDHWLKSTRELRDFRIPRRCCYLHWRDGKSPLTSFCRCKHPNMLHSGCCRCRTWDRHSQRTFVFKVANIKEKYFHNRTRARTLSYCGTHGEEPLHFSLAKTYQIYYHLDRQHRCIILDDQSCEKMGIVYGQQSDEDSGDHSTSFQCPISITWKYPVCDIWESYQTHEEFQEPRETEALS